MSQEAFFEIGEILYQKYRQIRYSLLERLMPSKDLEILAKHFPYYAKLSPKNQKAFRKKLAYFISIKKFVPRGGLEAVTREMVVLISATAVMVAYGFDSVNFLHFKKILVYPDNYYSTITKQYHKGEVNPKLGIIVVSWSNFVHGLGHAQDGINLGIHEMAHALKLENLIHYNNESNFFNPRTWKAFEDLANQEIALIDNGGESIFRNSATRNLHEFFAVAVEVFFEKPAELKSARAELYETLAVLLRQDPLVLFQEF
ncbi:zinc-dependent peptidase [Mariniradius sediminis]|uniref:Zinc-dependent peptidase n=1 Tax=Mariniradius sediminis TaxID=2909237 RepID=A0ABS9BZX5_9BACT|nr:zinc-dependent peptidase [Mariniradius sediminis]MCF1752870.1 zinc-dependent peptidase [Mariniradius sediminis]